LQQENEIGLLQDFRRFGTVISRHTGRFASEKPFRGLAPISERIQQVIG
jgi:hypothetical protein